MQVRDQGLSWVLCISFGGRIFILASLDGLWDEGEGKGRLVL